MESLTNYITNTLQGQRSVGIDIPGRSSGFLLVLKFQPTKQMSWRVQSQSSQFPSASRQVVWISNSTAVESSVQNVVQNSIMELCWWGMGKQMAKTFGNVRIHGEQTGEKMATFESSRRTVTDLASAESWWKMLSPLLDNNNPNILLITLKFNKVGSLKAIFSFEKVKISSQKSTPLFQIFSFLLKLKASSWRIFH